MKRICRCGVEYRYNIENCQTEYITENRTAFPVKFCHECGNKLDKIDLNTLMREYFDETTFNEAIKLWDSLGGDVICLYRGEVHVFKDSLEYRSQFKVHLGMILEGQWYISTNYKGTTLKDNSDKSVIVKARSGINNIPSEVNIDDIY